MGVCDVLPRLSSLLYRHRLQLHRLHAVDLVSVYWTVDLVSIYWTLSFQCYTRKVVCSTCTEPPGLYEESCL